MDGKTISAYDKIAANYNERNNKSMWTQEFEYLDKHVNGKKILDIGCGAGRDAEFFIHHKYDYTGIDGSSGMLELARKRLPGANFLQMDFYHLMFQPESFDCFIACGSLLHVPKQDIGNILMRIKDIVKPGGIGLITVKKKRTVDEAYIKQDELGIERYFAFYEEDEFLDILRKNAYAVIAHHQKKENDGTVWYCFFIKV